MKNKLAVLKTAQELRDDKQTNDARMHTESHDRSLKLVLAEIEKALEYGRSEIYSLNCVESVEALLREKGYEVNNAPACGMGDMSSIHISWN